MENKVPIRFFVFTFLWSWVFFAIAIFFGYGNTHDSMFSAPGIEMLFVMIGAFGPAVGAICSVYTIEGKGTFKEFL